ncbi:hypothetical protein MMC22_006832 [Lobaria immixta]|nr:hypothetical protein [Lobaria immixta]
MPRIRLESVAAMTRMDTQEGMSRDSAGWLKSGRLGRQAWAHKPISRRPEKLREELRAVEARVAVLEEQRKEEAADKEAREREAECAALRKKIEAAKEKEEQLQLELASSDGYNFLKENRSAKRTKHLD